MKTFLRFVSFLDILDVPACDTPYILFKLKKVKKSEVISTELHTLKVVLERVYSHPFSLIENQIY